MKGRTGTKRGEDKTRQLNAMVAEQLVLDFKDFCATNGFSRDKQVARALDLLLDLEYRKPPRRVVFKVDRRTARTLLHRREERDLAEAVGSLIRVSDGQKR